MFKFRPSYLKQLVQNPANYWKATQDISNLKAVKQGIEREKLSYSLYETLTNDKDYHAQQWASKSLNDWTIEGTADIVSKEAIIDIKNSIQDDKKLIDEYKYQLSAYCYLFNKTKAYLFVDSNKAQEQDLSKVRLIEVEIIPAKEFEVLMDSLCKTIQELDKLNFNLIIKNQDVDYEKELEKYFSNKEQIKKLEAENKELEKKFDKVYENDKFIVQYEATRKFNTKITKTPTNEYTVKLAIKEK